MEYMGIEVRVAEAKTFLLASDKYFDFQPSNLSPILSKRDWKILEWTLPMRDGYQSICLD